MNGCREHAAENPIYPRSLWTRTKSQRWVFVVVPCLSATVYMLMRDAYVTGGHNFLSSIVPQSFSANEVVFYSNETSYIDHMKAVLKGCGEICQTDMPGIPSLYHDYIEKQVNCKAILSNPAIDAMMGDPEPPSTIPTEMMDDFTYGGKVRFTFFDQGIFNQRYLGKKVSGRPPNACV